MFNIHHMKHHFYKYQGAGNDFVIFDNRTNALKRLDDQLYNRICDRKFGVGADGLMLLQDHPEHDFEMVYFNADGSESTMCGNGGRCLVAFAKRLDLIGTETKFLAADGLHYAKISGETIHLQMIDVPSFHRQEKDYVLHTGSPHYIRFVKDADALNVYEEGREIRYSGLYREEGINVNFVEDAGDHLFVRTYERGVEDETLSCGTGVTASAIAYAIEKGLYGKQEIVIRTRGGALRVTFNREEDRFTEVFLVGPAEYVFEGEIVF
jgi:diaminopimelate epimerase